MFKFLLKRLLIVLLLASASGLFAQNQILVVGENSEIKNEAILAYQDDNQASIRFELNAVELIEVETGYGKAFIVTSDKSPLMLAEENPEMFYLTSTFIIPDQGSSELEISYGAYQDFGDIEIAPSKGNLSRSVDPSTVPFVKGGIYQKDGFYPGTLASLREPFIMRDVRGQSVDVYPVQYNPVTKILRVYSEITVTVKNTKIAGINEFAGQKRNKTIEPQFNEMYKNLFINHVVMQEKGYPTEEEGELLIICHPAFMDVMKPYIDWKRTIGRKTTMVSTTETGTTNSAIKTYITNYYNDPNNSLAYVLFVGDSPQIPAYPATGAQSDVEYGKITGSDHYLEILIGRMSASEVAHVQTQVQRSIEYERDITTADSWISAAVGIATSDGNGGGHDGGEADYAHMNNIRTRLMTYGYDPVYQEYYGNCPGVPNSSNAQISSRFNSGAGMANYCNHGSLTAWTPSGGPNYSNTEVNQLQNAGKLPFIFSVACNNGEFMSGTCFAEAWLRATQNNQPSGAVATLMATISIGWLPPMTAQDEFVNICMDLPTPYGPQEPGTKRTIAGAMLNATQKMIMKHGASGKTLYDYNSWVVFGDPTLMFRTKTPQEMTISHLPTILFGMNSFAVNCNAEGATATLSYVDNSSDVIILGTATVTGGIAEITLVEPITMPIDLTLAVTGFNKVAYTAMVQAIPAGGSYVVPVGYDVVGGGELTYISEGDEIEVTLKNVGSDPTTGLVTVSISSVDSQLTIDSGTAQHVGVIAPDGTATVRFSVTVSNDIPDGKIFPVDVTVTSGSKAVWESKLPLTAYAPDLELSGVLIDGIEGGDLVPGSLSILTVAVKNSGGADAYDVIGDLEFDDPYITIACDDARRGSGGDIISGGSMNFDFYVIVDPSMPYGHQADFDLLLSAQYGISGTLPFTAACSGSDNYCSSGTQNCGDDKFTSVILEKTSEPSVLLINNTSSTCSSGGYQDYTGTNFTLEPGEQYTIKVKVGFGSQYVRGWFDLNGNNAFDANEQLINDINSISANTEITRTFTVPGNCVPGSFRFRLACKYNSAPVACNNSSYGQTHDYTFTVPEMYGRVQDVVAVLEDTDITVTWGAPAEGMPTGYNVYRNGNLLNSSPLTALTCTEENVEQGVYAYNVTALYTGDKESYAEMSNVICYFIACESPANVGASIQGNTAIITWEAPETIEGELLRYNIYRDGEKTGEVSAAVLEYQDKDLSHGTYVYRVSAAYDHCEESELSESVTVLIQPCEAPVGFAGFAAEDTAVLTWELPTEGTPTGYNIYRNEERITENIAGLEYRDEDLANGTYIYQISAVYGHCESDLTEGVSVVIDDTGISDAQTDSFRIFPNPAHNELNIKGSVVPVSVRMYNVTGQLMYEADQCAAKMKIPVAAMPTGVYFVKIDSEHGSVTKKVVVK